MKDTVAKNAVINNGIDLLIPILCCGVLIVALIGMPALSFSQTKSTPLQNELKAIDDLLGENKDSLAQEKLESLTAEIETAKDRELIWYYKLYGDCLFGQQKLNLSRDGYLNLWELMPDNKQSTNHKAKALNDLGIVYYQLGNLDSAKLCHRLSLVLYEQTENHQGKAYNYNNLGIVFGSKRQLDSALYYQEKGVEAAILAKDSIGVGFGYLNMGINHGNLDQLQEAVKYLLKAKSVFEQLKNQNLVNRTKLELSSIYVLLDDNDQALALLFELRPFYIKSKNNFLKGRVALDIYQSYNNKGQYDSASVYLDECIHFYNQQGNPRLLAKAYTQKGLVEYRQKNFQRALYFLKKSDSLFSNPFLIDKNTNRAIQVQVYTALNDSEQASRISLAALSEQENFLRPRERSHMYKAIYVYYKQEKKWPLALKYLELLKENDDSLLREMSDKELARIEYNHKSEQERLVFEAEKEKVELELSQKKLQLYLAFIGVGALVIIAALAIRSYLNKQKSNQKLLKLNEEISNQKEEIIQQSEELKTSHEKLQELNHFKESMTGMIVHDLKNPLSVIMHDQQGSKVSKQMASQMLQLVSNMLDVYKFEQAKMVLGLGNYALSQVIDHAINQVSQLADDKDLSIHADITHSITVNADDKILNRVLVNILNNAIKYSNEQGDITIEASVLEENVQVMIKDEGVGIPAEKSKLIFESYEQVNPRQIGEIASTGLGLSFCKMAIEAHGGKIWVESELGIGSTFYFTIPKGEEITIEVSDTENQGNAALLLSDQEKEQLAAYLPKLQAMKELQLVEAQSILNTLHALENSALEEWKVAVLKACFHENQKQFDELLSLAAE